MKKIYFIRIVAVLFCLCNAFVLYAALPKVIAHRGHWTVSGAAQNSVCALVKADSINCYGSEFDVWMTADGELVINHDRDIAGTVIEDSPAAEVLSKRLANGESISSLSGFLDKAAGLDIRLILEMKQHSDTLAEREAVRKIVDMIHDKGLDSKVEYITFSRYGLQEFIRIVPVGTPVYYLTGNMSPAKLKSIGAAGLDYELKVLMEKPEWIDEAHELGLKVNVWTVDRESDMQWCIDKRVDFITTNHPEKLYRLLWK